MTEYNYKGCRLPVRNEDGQTILDEEALREAVATTNMALPVTV